jgi:hypothetical protein
MRLYSTFLFVFFALWAQSMPIQDTGRVFSDIRRARLHEEIAELQKRVLSADGKADRSINFGVDLDLDLLLTDVYTRQLEQLHSSIEQDPGTDHRIKVKYLTGLQQVLEGLLKGWNSGVLMPENGLQLFDAFSKYMAADRQDKDFSSLVSGFPYAVNQVLLGNNSVFFENPGIVKARIVVFQQFASTDPDKALPQLEPYLDQPFANSVIVAAAKKNPSLFYDYAAATETVLGKKIRTVPDTLVQLMVTLSSDPSGRLLFPFLHLLRNGKATLPEIRASLANDLSYYRLLIKTQLQYLDAMRAADTPVLMNEMASMIKSKAASVFINEINALHDEPDEVRFRKLQGLSPEELYYIIVTGEDLLYTSSYTGVYSRLMARVPRSAGDQLLLMVRFDRFKKFIRMAAGYNRLDAFLSSMPEGNAQLLMKAFVRGLDQNMNLEDAVDVADSYASIKRPEIRALLVNEIEINLRQQTLTGTKRGRTIYDILHLLFLSASDSVSQLSSRYHIPPVYQLPFTELADQAGRVVQQVFFYGDKDGKESFANFMSMFRGKKEWKIVQQAHWVEIKSLVGQSIWIFANLPLDNSKGDDPDAKAQQLLHTYLEENGLHPSIVIHRGHSYHLKYTLEQLPASSRIVVLGSCGSYQNLHAVLEVSPAAHIVSSKEVGTKMVNEPVLHLINESLRSGRSVEWIRIWGQLERQFSTGVAKERFDNYIPPHKNLGALFIKAYSNSENEGGNRLW